jgi:tryptophanyl-tRNA synthetase
MPYGPRVFSGIQPTGGGGFHLGNYLGAVHQWVGMQDDHDALYCVVDLHALTVAPDPDQLRNRTRESAAELLAVGIDPQRCTLFLQSHVQEHAELGWVLGCLTGFGEASRMTQFKDRSSRYGSDRVSVGVFTYPLLQAADILLYQADLVPVGEDQRQHVELTRDLAERFNRRYGLTFTVPAPFIPAGVGKVLDLAEPARQMSKSIGGPGVVFLQDDPDLIRKKIRAAVTDAGREVRVAEDKPGISNLLRILAGLSGRSVAELEADFAGRGYGEFKSEVAETVVAAVKPIQTRYRELLADPAELDRLVAIGADRARGIATETMRTVRERVGLLAPGG